MFEISNVQLRVRNLRDTADFYSRLGFVAQESSLTALRLATSATAAPILELVGGGSPAPSDAARLFHAALIFDDRAGLGAWLRQAGERGIEFDGFADHGVSEALYFQDPEGNGLEFYVDR